jgi:hypothetical protein
MDSRLHGNDGAAWIPACAKMTADWGWIPACAGMTAGWSWIPACAGMTWGGGANDREQAGMTWVAAGLPRSPPPRHPRERVDPSGASDNPPRSLQTSSSRTRGSKRSLRQPTALPTNVILANAGTHFDVGLPPQNPLHQPLRRPIRLIPTLRPAQSRQRIHRYLLAHLHPPLIKGVDVPDH